VILSTKTKPSVQKQNSWKNENENEDENCHPELFFATDGSS